MSITPSGWQMKYVCHHAPVSSDRGTASEIPANRTEPQISQVSDLLRSLADFSGQSRLLERDNSGPVSLLHAATRLEYLCSAVSSGELEKDSGMAACPMSFIIPDISTSRHA